MPSTPEEWLPILTDRLDRRASRIKLLRSYCDGDAPLPEMGKHLRASWEAFQKKARVNYGGLAVWALKNRIRPRGVRIGGGADTADDLAAAQRIWRDNRLQRQFGAAIQDRLEVGIGYLVVGTRGPKAVITREKPELFIAIPDPLLPWKAVVALKVWRDEIAGLDFAYVWVAGARQKFVRASKKDGVMRTRAVSDDWELEGEPETYVGDPPVIILERADQMGLVEPHHDVIDGLNLAKLQRLVITAMQAFKQRALRSKEGSNGQGGLPDKDPDGNDIDYTKLFEHAPGALWELPDGIDVWESEATDVRPLLDGEKSDARTFAAVTRTPVSVFIPEGQNQSAEGAANAKEGHVSLAEDEIDDLGPGLAVALVYALRFEGRELGDNTLEIDFAPPALVSLTEKYAAAAQAKAAGLARRTILRDVLGMSPEAISLDEADLAEEQLSALALTGGLGGGPGGDALA